MIWLAFAGESFGESTAATSASLTFSIEYNITHPTLILTDQTKNIEYIPPYPDRPGKKERIYPLLYQHTARHDAPKNTFILITHPPSPSLSSNRLESNRIESNRIVPRATMHLVEYNAQPNATQAQPRRIGTPPSPRHLRKHTRPDLPGCNPGSRDSREGCEGGVCRAAEE